MRHPCAWPECLALCDVREFTCAPHWARLPASARRELSKAAGERRSAIVALTKATDDHAPASERRALRAKVLETQAADERIKAAVVEMLEENVRASDTDLG